MGEVALLGAVRTPIGSMGGAFAETSAVALGIVAAKEALRRAAIAPERVQETVFGNVLSAGLGQNPARQIALGAGVPKESPALTVNQVCGSGLTAIELAWEHILLGRAEVILAGGTENMSQAPYLLPAMRAGARLGDAKAVDSMVHDGLWDIFNDYHMGVTAENVAGKFAVSREEQDAFALNSQRKCAEAQAAGYWAEEIAPVSVKKRKGEVRVDQDEHPRPESSAEGMRRLRPAFREDGTVTAANASGINDGAAAVVVAAAEAIPPGIRKDGVFYLRDVRSCGCDPAFMGMGPVGAVRQILERNGLRTEDIGVWELNEAFAAQSIAVIRELNLDPDRVNPSGGGIALGHPIGCSGARVTVTLWHHLRRKKARYGIAALCIGGGQGIACLLESSDVDS